MMRTSRWLAPLALSLMTLAASVAQAEAPQQWTQVPGYYRHALGGFEVTALYDGQINLDTKLLKHATPAQIRKALDKMYRTDPTATSVNAYLVNTGGKLVLVDTGAAKVFGPTLGSVAANLKAAGYDPADVDAIVITHLHGDHVGGLLTPEGQVIFSKATVYVDKAEADYWLSPENLAKAPEAMKMFFQAAQTATAPYVQAGRFKTFEGEAELVPGLKPVNEHGHTPGHSGYLFESKGQKLLVWGDVVHNGAVQFPDPKVTIDFDSDQPKALATRLKLMGWAAKDRSLLVAAAHLPFPGLGHIRAEGKGSYAWVPVDFTPVAPLQAPPAVASGASR